MIEASGSGAVAWKGGAQHPREHHGRREREQRPDLVVKLEDGVHPVVDRIAREVVDEKNHINPRRDQRSSGDERAGETQLHAVGAQPEEETD